MGLCKISLAFVFLLGLTLVDPSLGQDSIEDYLNAQNAAHVDAYAKIMLISVLVNATLCTSVCKNIVKTLNVATLTS